MAENLVRIQIKNTFIISIYLGIHNIDTDELCA